MGKGRAPCCDKSKVKRGPWSPQEDLTLITFIQKHGHHNWRSLPKLAGLMRCGKSCRLRWINYLRPDVKRGNFTKEEEDAIIHFHQTLGNKWSKIASFLPGRTDNEIKNVWNTHLKKRLSSNSSPSSSFNSGLNNDSPPSLSSTTHLHRKCLTYSSNLEVNELRDIHDDFDDDDITSTFLLTNEMLFPLDHALLHHIPTEFHNTGGVTQLEVMINSQSFDHPQTDIISCQFDETNGEFDLWTQLLESTSPTSAPNSDHDHDYNHWFNLL